MTTRKYLTEDYEACMWIAENADPYGNTVVDTTLTVAIVERLRLLNLVDGPVEQTRIGEFVKLAGLGVKTAAEGARLGFESLTPPIVE